MKFLACFGGGFKCNRKVVEFEKTHNFMTAIPEEIYRHSRTLQELSLDSNNIKDLPKQFFKLVNLKKLSLSDNDLAQLGTDISQLRFHFPFFLFVVRQFYVEKIDGVYSFIVSVFVVQRVHNKGNITGYH